MCIVDGEQNTILLNSNDGLHWERAEPYPVLKVTEDYEGTYRWLSRPWWLETNYVSTISVKWG